MQIGGGIGESFCDKGVVLQRQLMPAYPLQYHHWPVPAEEETKKPCLWLSHWLVRFVVPVAECK